MSVPSTLPSVESRPPVAEVLLALAPLNLPQRRQFRYAGDDLCVALEELDAADQAMLKDLYAILTELLLDIADKSTDDTQKWQTVARWTQRHDLNSLFDRVRSLGRASRLHAHEESLAKAMHDVRGGALNALLGRLQIQERLAHNEEQLKTLFVLARDHLKIMRNAITGLDDARREADRTPKSHAMSLMVEKWHGSVVGPKWRERPVQMNVDCRYDGALTECCLESAAVDRIFYNLANNASRHAAGGRLDMAIFPVGESPGTCLRFVLSNEVDEQDAAFLRVFNRPEAGADSEDKGSGLSLMGLFEPTVTTTGSGFGLTVVAEFVAGAFGLRGRAEALRERYVGARLEGQTFRVWFHWPMADASLPQKLDDFHRPEQSLSEAA